MLFLALPPYQPQHTGSLGWFGQWGKIPAQIPIFPAKSLVHVMKAPQDRLSTHSRVCTRTAEHGTYGRWRVARVQGYGIVAAAAACMPACSEGITAVIAPLGTVNQVI